MSTLLTSAITVSVVLSSMLCVGLRQTFRGAVVVLRIDSAVVLEVTAIQCVAMASSEMLDRISECSWESKEDNSEDSIDYSVVRLVG